MKTTIAAALFVWVSAVPASGALLSVTGQGDILVPNGTNANLTPNVFDDAGWIHGWNELQGVTLTSDLIADIVVPGSYSGPFTSASATIAAGTRVNSHMLYQDPVNEGTRAETTWTFDSDILGIVLLSDDGDRHSFDRLFDTDYLRHPLTSSPGAGINDRGVEFGPEFLLWLPDMRTLALTLQSGSPGDQVRVITASSLDRQIDPVPEPASLLLLGTGLAWMARRLRRV